MIDLTGPRETTPGLRNQVRPARVHTPNGRRGAIHIL